MNSKPKDQPVIFREVQRPSLVWIIILPLVTAVAAVPIWYVFINQVILGHMVGKHPAPNALLMITWFLVGICLPYIFLKMKLTTEVRNDGIYIRFSPFHIRNVKIPVSDIKEYKMIEYDTFSRFGGWGIRYNFKREKAYNVGGGWGMQIHTSSKVVVIGTRNPEAFHEACETMFQRQR